LSGALNRKRMIEPLSDLLYPIAFFDGAAQGSTGGVGCRFWISPVHFFDLWMGLEQCTNNCSEIIALWVCLYWGKVLGITDLRIRGNSKVIIDWYNHKAVIHSIILQPWCRSIQHINKHFTNVSVQHLYRELNEDADSLSKRGIGGQTGILHFEELQGSTIIRSGHNQIF